MTYLTESGGLNGNLLGVEQDLELVNTLVEIVLITLGYAHDTEVFFITIGRDRIPTLKLGQDTGDSARAAAAGHGNVVRVLLL